MPERSLGPRDEARRRFLVRALAAGLLAGGTGWQPAALASVFGKRPRQLPEGQSIFDLRGQVRVNGEPAGVATRVAPGDTVETGPGSYVIYAVGANAYLLRENSRLETRAAGKVLRQALRLVTGKLLGVFGRRAPDERLLLHTANATIGIRGTGAYAEAEADRTYLCTCYGTTDLAAAPDYRFDGAPGRGAATETASVSARHHDAPKYILSEPENGQRIVAAPFINHTDLELMTLEALVGREVPFGLPAEQYEAPRRDY